MRDKNRSREQRGESARSWTENMQSLSPKKRRMLTYPWKIMDWG